MTTYLDDFHNPFKKEYWNIVDEIIEYANSLNIYMALLPNWGSFVKNEIFTHKQFIDYYKFLANRYKNKKNIIWVLGGDVRGDTNIKLFEELGSLLKAMNPDKLIAFHPFGRTASYQWFKDSKWLDIHMFQSGHRRYDQVNMNTWDDNNGDDVFGEDNYKYVTKALSINNKPVLDGEPSYEGIVQGLHDITQPYWEEEDVRRYAYWSALKGACGHTYGHNAIMQFYRFNENGSYGVKEEWLTAIDNNGAKSMRLLKDLMLKYDFTAAKPYDEAIIENGTRHNYIAAMHFKNAILVYDYLGIPFNIKLDKAYSCYLINPLNGERKFLFKTLNKEEVNISINENKATPDWLILFE